MDDGLGVVEERLGDNYFSGVLFHLLSHKIRVRKSVGNETYTVWDPLVCSVLRRDEALQVRRSLYWFLRLDLPHCRWYPIQCSVFGSSRCLGVVKGGLLTGTRPFREKE